MSFDKTKVETGLSGLVGYRPSLDPNFFVLDATNLQSDSGYYVNDNPFAEIEAFKVRHDAVLKQILEGNRKQELKNGNGETGK